MIRSAFKILNLLNPFRLRRRRRIILGRKKKGILRRLRR